MLLAMEFPAMVGAAFLLPGLVNRYGKIERRLTGIEGWLTRIEMGMGIETSV